MASFIFLQRCFDLKKCGQKPILSGNQRTIANKPRNRHMNLPDLQPFEAHSLLKNPHMQTIIGRYLPGPRPGRRARLHKIACHDGDVLVALENRSTRKSAFKKIMVLMHGLAGDAESPYMLRMASRCLERGWSVFRMNHRGCGAGAGLARSTYHSGRSDDVAHVLRAVRDLYPSVPQIAVGFSMSGNALLKLLGEGKEELPETLKGAVAVAPPVELSLCAHELCRPSRRVYDYRFVRDLTRSMRERALHYPDFPRFNFHRNMTVYDFDEIVTAPLHGFDSAEDYYRRCSAKQFLGSIKLPTALIGSMDDPFVPAASYHNLPQNPNVGYCLTAQGGHMGYISAEPTPLRDHRWMDYAVLRYAEALLAGAA